MKNIITGFLFFYLLSFVTDSWGQIKDYNLSFEKGMNGWMINDIEQNITYEIEDSVYFDGGHSLFLKSQNKSHFIIGTLINLMHQKGKLEISYWLRHFASTDSLEVPHIFIQTSEQKVVEMVPDSILNQRGWVQYSTKLEVGPLDMPAIGIIYTGEENIYIDSLTITLNGIPCSKMKSALYPLFEEDHEFDQFSGVDQFTLTRLNISRLYYLSKIWGLLKYYHPHVSQGRFNWDYELFRILPSVLNESNNFDEVMLNWMDQLGLSSEPGTDSIIDSHSKLFQWLQDKEIGEALSEKLQQVISHANNDFNYYVSFLGQTNPVFENENSYSDFNNDCGYRLLALFRAWNIIEYFFPYKHLTDRNWDRVLKKYIPVFIQANTLQAYQKSLLLFSTEICDSHTGVYDGAGKNIYDVIGLENDKSLSVILRYLNNKTVITKVIEGRNSPFQVGDVITHLDRQRMKKIIKKYSPYFSASNELGKANNILNYLKSAFNKDSIEVKWKSGHKRFKEYVKTVKSQQYIPDSTVAWKIIDGTIGYIQVGYFDIKQTDSVMNHFKDLTGIILDMRVYPKSFMIYQLARYLLPDTTDFALYWQTSVSRPGIFEIVDTAKIGTCNTNYYKGKVGLIVNNSTFSQGEFTAMGWGKAPHAIVIGEQTQGADGNVTGFYVPGNYYITFSGLGISYPNGMETQRKGIAIDKKISPTVKGMREGRDELLESAVEILKKE